MYLEKWLHGCRVSVAPWLNGKHRIGVENFAPGASLSQPPKWERAMYIDDSSLDTAIFYLDSVVWNMIYRYNELSAKGIIREAKR